MALLGLLPRLLGVAAIELGGRDAKLLAGVVQLAFGNGQQPIDGQAAEAFLQPQLLLELVAPEPEGRASLGRLFGFQVVDVPANRGGRLGGRIGEIAEQVEVVDVTQRARQVALDEAQRALERVDADLHEDAGRVLDVVARRLQQSRGLPQLGQDPAGAFGGRRVGEDGLGGQARREDVRVEMRVALPGAHVLELEQPRPHVVGQHRQFGRFDGAKARRVDLPQPAGEAGKRARVGLDGLPAEVFEQVVVKVDAVETRPGSAASPAGSAGSRRRSGAAVRRNTWATKEPMVQ